jgi:hypothetical protein
MTGKLQVTDRERIEQWKTLDLDLNVEHHAEWARRWGLKRSGWHPCIRRLAIGLMGCRGLHEDGGCTCGWTFGADDEMLVLGNEPLVLFGHRRRIDCDYLRRSSPVWPHRGSPLVWIDRWPKLQLTITGGSWVIAGGVVVAIYNRDVWAKREEVGPGG